LILAKPKIVTELKTSFLKVKPFVNLEDIFGSKTASFEIQNETIFRIKPLLIGF
jgi:hypothetical protein